MIMNELGIICFFGLVLKVFVLKLFFVFFGLNVMLEILIVDLYIENYFVDKDFF